MHGKYRRRRLRAERDFAYKRQTTSTVITDDGVAPDTGNGDSNVFTAPITLTVIETIAEATSASTTQMTTLTSVSTMSPVIDTTTTQTTTVSTPTTTTSTLTSTSTLATSSSSTSTVAPVPSVLPPSATSSTTSSPAHKGNNTEAQGDLSTSSTSLTGGGIAGIVIACLVLVAAVLIFFLRKRFIQRRRKRTSAAWTTRSGTFNPTSFGFGSSNEPKIEPFQSFRPGDSENIPISDVTPPAMAMNSPTSPYTNSPVSSFTRYPSTAGGALSPKSPLNLTPFRATVVCTFATTLPDELSITIGERMRVLAEYDDGWALCMKTNGEQGMVPLECLDQSGTSNNNTFGLPVDSRGSRRISSLDGVGPKVARS